MKILLLGATGRTGRHILNELLDNGHLVHCLARNVKRISAHPNLQTFEGDPRMKEDLTTAMSGCEAVISALNISRRNDFPWAPLRTPKLFLSEVAENLLAVAQQTNLKRIVVCSAWGVGETNKDIPWWFKWFIDNSNIGVAYADHERQEALLINSGCDWSIVRPVGLTNFKKRETIRASFDNQPKPSLLISRRSVARYMVEIIENSDMVSKKVVISAV